MLSSLLFQLVVLNDVVIVILDEFVVLDLFGNVVVDVLVELACVNVFLVVVNVVVPFFSSEVVVNNIVVDNLCVRGLLETILCRRCWF